MNTPVRRRRCSAAAAAIRVSVSGTPWYPSSSLCQLTERAHSGIADGVDRCAGFETRPKPLDLQRDVLGAGTGGRSRISICTIGVIHSNDIVDDCFAHELVGERRESPPCRTC